MAAANRLRSTSSSRTMLASACVAPSTSCIRSWYALWDCSIRRRVSFSDSTCFSSCWTARFRCIFRVATWWRAARSSDSIFAFSRRRWWFSSSSLFHSSASSSSPGLQNPGVLPGVGGRILLVPAILLRIPGVPYHLRPDPVPSTLSRVQPTRFLAWMTIGINPCALATARACSPTSDVASLVRSNAHVCPLPVFKFEIQTWSCTVGWMGRPTPRRAPPRGRPERPTVFAVLGSRRGANPKARVLQNVASRGTCGTHGRGPSHLRSGYPHAIHSFSSCATLGVSVGGTQARMGTLSFLCLDI